MWGLSKIIVNKVQNSDKNNLNSGPIFHPIFHIHIKAMISMLRLFHKQVIRIGSYNIELFI